MSRYGQNSIVHQPSIRPDISVPSKTCAVGEQTPLNSKEYVQNKDETNQRNEHHIYQNYDYDPPPNKSMISEEQTPLQRPRPPEHRCISHDPNDYDEVTPSPELPRRTLSFGNRNQSSVVQQNGFNDISSSTSTPTPSVPRRNKRDNGGNTPQSRWSSRISERLSSVIINPFMYVNNNANFSDRTRNSYKYETCAINSDDTNMNNIPKDPCFQQEDRRKSCANRKMCCLVIVPSIILSLIVISVCSLFIYFHMIQVKSIIRFRLICIGNIR